MKKILSAVVFLFAMAVSSAFGQTAAGGSGPVKPEQVLLSFESRSDIGSERILKRIQAVEDAELAGESLRVYNNEDRKFYVIKVKDIPWLPAGKNKDLALRALEEQILSGWADYVESNFRRVDKNVTVIEPQEAETRRLIALLEGKLSDERERLLLTGADFKSMRDQISRHGASPEAFIGSFSKEGFAFSTIIRIAFNIDTLLRFTGRPPNAPLLSTTSGK
jgi:hypothetical protein